MPRWDYTLKIKDLFEPNAEDHDEVARRIGPVAADRVRALAKKLEDKQTWLSGDLDDIADWFADCAEDHAPQAVFNEALRALYDLGDSHRVWIA